MKLLYHPPKSGNQAIRDRLFEPSFGTVEMNNLSEELQDQIRTGTTSGNIVWEEVDIEQILKDNNMDTKNFDGSTIPKIMEKKDYKVARVALKNTELRDSRENSQEANQIPGNDPTIDEGDIVFLWFDFCYIETYRQKMYYNVRVLKILDAEEEEERLIELEKEEERKRQEEELARAALAADLLRLDQQVRGMRVAEDRRPVAFNSVLEEVNYYNPGEIQNNAELGEKVSIFLTVITNIGMIVAILMLAIIGIKYMLGSVEEKAEYKKDLVPYLVGAILLFGITTFMRIFLSLGKIISNI